MAVPIKTSVLSNTVHYNISKSILLNKTRHNRLNQWFLIKSSVTAGFNKKDDMRISLLRTFLSSFDLKDDTLIVLVRTHQGIKNEEVLQFKIRKTIIFDMFSCEHKTERNE